MIPSEPPLKPHAVAVVVNGASFEAAAPTLDALIVEAGFGAQRVATALNGVFVPERARSETKLSAGDRVEILTPRQGG
jgi:sulfur carrier protein